MRIFACCFLALVCVSAFAQEAQQIPVGAVPRGVAFYPSGNQLIVSSFANNSVSVLDLGTLELRTIEESVSTAAGVAVDDQLGLAVVANSESNEVTLIDLVTLQVVTRIPVGSRPLSVDINSSTHIAVVSNSSSNTLSLIDLNKAIDLDPASVVGTVSDVPVLSGAVQAVAVNSATNVAVVASPSQNSIILVDLAESRVVDTLTVGASPVAVAVNPVTNVAVVCNANGNSISIVNLGTGEIEELPIGSPQGAAIHIRTNTAVISSNTSNEVVLLDLNTNQVIGQVSSLTGPAAAATNQAGRQTAVVLPSNNSVALVDIPVVGSFTIVNAAAFQGGPLAPGMIVSGFGTDLASQSEVATGLPLPTTLGGVRIRLDRGGQVIGGGGSVELNAPLFFVSPTQINFQIPAELAQDVPMGEVRSFPFVVFRSSGSQLRGDLLLGAASPALFSQLPMVSTTLNTPASVGLETITPASMAGIYPGIYLLVGSEDNAEVVKVISVTETTFTAFFANSHGAGDTVVGAQTGFGPVAALNEDGSVLSVDGCLDGAKPAPPGSLVQLFGTGQGALTPELAAGEPAPLEGPLSETPTLPEVTLGGVPVTVEFSGAAPNFVGLWQINIRIPDENEDPPSGPAVPIIVTIEGVSSPPFTTLAVNTDVQPCQP